MDKPACQGQPVELGRRGKKTRCPTKVGAQTQTRWFLQWEPKRKQHVSWPPLTLGATLCPVSSFLGLTKQVPKRKQKTGLPLEVLCFKLKSLNADDYKPETWAEWLDSWPTYQMFWGPLKSNITQTPGKCTWIYCNQPLLTDQCQSPDLGLKCDLEKTLCSILKGWSHKARESRVVCSIVQSYFDIEFKQRSFHQSW